MTKLKTIVLNNITYNVGDFYTDFSVLFDNQIWVACRTYNEVIKDYEKYWEPLGTPKIGDRVDELVSVSGKPLTAWDFSKYTEVTVGGRIWINSGWYDHKLEMVHHFWELKNIFSSDLN